jgi:uncharacterized protein DUF6867
MSWLYASTGGGLLAFGVLTGLGFLASLATGRSFATSWSPLWLIIPAMLALAAAVHFLHYALFQEDLASVYYFLVTFLVLLAGAALGYRSKRADQMGTQYRWLFHAEGMFWRERDAH